MSSLAAAVTWPSCNAGPRVGVFTAEAAIRCEAARSPADSFDATASITICAFTTDESDLPLFRLPVAASAGNGLRAPCRLMVDKITTVPKSKLGTHIGRLDEADIARLDRAIVVFLGLAAATAAGS